MSGWTQYKATYCSIDTTVSTGNSFGLRVVGWTTPASGTCIIYEVCASTVIAKFDCPSEVILPMGGIRAKGGFIVDVPAGPITILYDGS